jgi:hypothetical protein
MMTLLMMRLFGKIIILFELEKVITRKFTKKQHFKCVIGGECFMITTYRDGIRYILFAPEASGANNIRKNNRIMVFIICVNYR